MACLHGRVSRSARLWRWLQSHWRLAALLLLVAPALLTLGMYTRDPRSGNILISAACLALFVGLLGTTAKFSFLGFRWQPLLVRRDALKACVPADLTNSYVQFAKLVVRPDQVRDLIEHAAHQLVIHCDELPSPTDKYSFGLCTIVAWVWGVPAIAPEAFLTRPPRTILGTSATKALFTLDARSRVLYVLAFGGYASVEDIATWLDESPNDVMARLAQARAAFDVAASA